MRVLIGTARLAVWTLLIATNQEALRGQLAITEVMSSASTNRGSVWVQAQSDFWELTNFGTNAIDLTDYKFSDSDDMPMDLFPDQVPPLTIFPSQSVIFVRFDRTTTEAQFRAWWGECLPASVAVSFYPTAPGFNATFDGVRLWDASGQLIDRVDFGVARSGVTFISDTNGEFGAYSQMGISGACQAATADDIGSLGTAVGPIPLQILLHPTNELACVGGFAVFRARASGLPRPRYQWFFNESAIPGATSPSYTITNTQPSHVGVYHVEFSNGLMSRTSQVATLTVSTNLTPPTVLSSPMDTEVYSNQTARFSISACAYPPASYQWFSNGVSLADATSPVLTILDCTPAMSGAQYCVRVANVLGTNTVCARLIVTSVPKLRITEIMSRPDPDWPQHTDWFEITNEGTNKVNLLGYRFSDSFTFAGGVTNTQTIVLNPGQSAVFVEQISAADFKQWWGEWNLPPDLTIVSYNGFGLSDLGDALYLWNAAATRPSDYVHSVAFEATTSVSSWRFNDAECLPGCESVVPDFGAFRAVEGNEVGSPGYTANPRPRLVNITRDLFGAHITWRAVEGASYRLEYNSTLQSDGWMPVGETVATNSLPTKSDLFAGGEQRFYRVLQLGL